MNDAPTVEPTNDPAVLQKWIGRSQTQIDVLDARHLRRLENTLNRPASLENGDLLPQLWHFVVHLDSVPQDKVGRDGHPQRGGFLPPVALPRRMWAGGRFEFHRDLRVGDTVTKTSTIDSVTPKQGRSGHLCFVTVRHELSVDGEACVAEQQDLVYREDPAPDAPAPTPAAAPTESDWQRAIEPDPVMLFRYSALTFNGHRIHYDREYAEQVEGYAGLVFHGPLTATLLADLAVTNTGRLLSTFEFRARSPLFDTAPFTVAGALADDGGADLWAATPEGGLAMTARATLR